MGGGSIKGSRVFCFLKIHQLKIISIPKRHDLGWQTLLPLITELGRRVTPSSQSRWSGSWMRWASGRPRACTPELSPRQDRAPGRGGGPARPVPHRAGDPATGPGLASGWSARHEGGAGEENTPRHPISGDFPAFDTSRVSGDHGQGWKRPVPDAGTWGAEEGGSGRPAAPDGRILDFRVRGTPQAEVKPTSSLQRTERSHHGHPGPPGPRPPAVGPYVTVP